MAPTRSLRRAVFTTVAASAAVMAAKRAADMRTAARFYERVGATTEPTDIGTFYGGFPGIWHRSDASETMHSASLEAVREMLPSSDLHPVRLPGERAIIYVSSLRHDIFSANGVDGLAMLPYGEVLVGALVTRRPAPPILPLIAPAASGMAAGAFVLHLPVTHRAARDAGRGLGYPKFTADMVLEDSIETVRMDLSEGGHRILTHTVRPAGQATVVGKPVTLYSSHEGQLLEQRVPRFGLYRRRWGRSGGQLDLGDHQVSEELRALEIDPQPFMAGYWTATRLSMPGPHPVGSAKPYLGFIGDERDLGCYIVKYPGTAPIDQYAPYASTARPLAATVELAGRAEPEMVGV